MHTTRSWNLKEAQEVARYCTENNLNCFQRTYFFEMEIMRVQTCKCQFLISLAHNGLSHNVEYQVS